METTAIRGVVRWARGALVAVCAALVVLVHHETAAAVVSSVQSSHHLMPGMASASVDAVETGSASHVVEASTPNVSEHGVDAGGCAEGGAQHCASASLDTVKLLPPPRSVTEQATGPCLAAGGQALPRTVGRAPPDLSILSQLRI